MMRLQLDRLQISAAVLALGGVAALAPSARAQLTGTNKPAGSSDVPTISVTTRLVVETVTVKDKKGNPVQGLTAKDFALTEDGVPQKISFCEHQTLSAPVGPLAPAPAGESDNITIYNRLAREQISAETPGQVKYKDKRLLALYFDMSAMQEPEQLRALTAAEKFVREQMTPDDMVAILRYEGSSVDVLQDFTADRSRLLSILSTLVVGEGQGDTDTSSDDASADTGAAFGQDDAEFNIFTTDRQLAALQTAAEQLEHLNEKKELIYFASGMTLNGLDNQAQLHATEQAAIKAGVTIWAVDSRGLTAEGPMGNARNGSPGGAAMYTGGSAMAMTSRLEQSQDTMYALAEDTGGKALLDYNDLTQGIVNAQKSVSDYYIIGYYSANKALDGKFRKIKVTVNPPTVDVALDYQHGYYAGKEFDKFTAEDKERQLEDALMLGDPITELTIAMEVNYFQLNHAEYFVPVTIKIPGSELALAKKRGAQVANLDFIGEIKDVYGGTTVNNIRDHVSFKLSDKTAEQWAKVPIDYYSGYTELPGKFTIKVLARDDATGKIGTFQATFEIPNLNKVTKQVPISSVVLSRGRQALSSALYNAVKGKELAKDNAADPLVQNDERLEPSVTRVFSRGGKLYVFLQAYEAPLLAEPSGSAAATAAVPAGQAAAPAAEPLIAYVSFYKGQNKVYETQPEEVQPIPNTRLDVTPIGFTVDLAGLQPGKYNCQVTVLDPMGKKGAFWQAPIMVVQ